MKKEAKIIYTEVDEAPLLATYSFLPILKAFAHAADIEIETRDISLAGRILAKFPEHLKPEQRVSDDLAWLGKLVKEPDANVIKLPNISASIPQLKAAIKELQKHGYEIPNYPEFPQDDKEREIKAIYDSVKGSAVNPVLREGNSNRRAPLSVKNYARKHPHSMGEWTKDSKAHVSHMTSGDLRHNEKSMTITKDLAGMAKIIFTDDDGNTTTLKEKLQLLEGEVVDASYMSKKALCKFFEEQIADAKKRDVLFSLHMKATMMKVSDPIIFGHAVSVFFKDVFEKHADTLRKLEYSPNNGLGDLYAKIQDLPVAKRREIEKDIFDVKKKGPQVAMVNSEKGITNFHVPSDVIVDASMPAAIRNSGKMWGTDGHLHDAKMVIPDSSYAGVYEEVVNFCKEHGAFDPKTMGTVPNIGLMAQKAEEYGSHDKTFLLDKNGTVRVVAENGEVLLEHRVEAGDFFRMCQTKDLPIRDWVKLSVTRAKASGMPAVFWLDKKRPHDAELIKKVNVYLKDHDTSDIEIHIMSPEEATRFSCERISDGKDTISVTGNVLRDYLTDLFPILEVGTSAKMLSIVPLMNGGGLFETGAGGSAPKHVQQFQKEGHLRWDSLGEFLALSASFEFLGNKTKNKKALVLAKTLDQANEMYLEKNKSPGRRVGELDNRGSHLYLARYWAEALANQMDDMEMKRFFAKWAKEINENKTRILDEINRTQGLQAEFGGYYKPDDELANKAMRPSKTFNKILEDMTL